MKHYLYDPEGAPETYDLKKSPEITSLGSGWLEIHFADPGLGRMLVKRSEVIECDNDDCLHWRIEAEVSRLVSDGLLSFPPDVMRAEAERRLWLAARPR